MDNQEAFDKVLSHLCRQDARSEGEGMCLYRDDNNNKCAVGCLIPDDVYKTGMEGVTVGDLLMQSYQLRVLLAGVTVTLLAQLQAFHDGIYKVLPESEGANEVDRKISIEMATLDDIASRHSVSFNIAAYSEARLNRTEYTVTQQLSAE